MGLSLEPQPAQPWWVVVAVVGTARRTSPPPALRRASQRAAGTTFGRARRRFHQPPLDGATVALQPGADCGAVKHPGGGAGKLRPGCRQRCWSASAAAARVLLEVMFCVCRPRGGGGATRPRQGRGPLDQLILTAPCLAVPCHATRARHVVDSNQTGPIAFAAPALTTPGVFVA